MPKKKNGPLQHWKNAITRRSSSTKRLFPLSSPSKQKSTAEESKTLSSGVDSTTVVPATIYPPPLSSWTAFAEELPTTDPHVGPMTDKVSKAPNTRHDGAVIMKPSSIDKSKSSITKRAPKRRDPQARAPTTKEVSFGTMRTLYSNSSRITMIDEVNKVFVIDAISPSLCNHIRALTDQHVRLCLSRGFSDMTWRTLYTYTKMDIPCCEVPGLPAVTYQIMMHVAKVIGDIFEYPRAAYSLRPRSWKEPHLLKYQKLPDREEHLGVEMHYDGGDFTWNLMLSDSSEYTGGGTYVRCLRKTIKLQQGQCLVHPGELYHKGVDITSGVRDLIVCFMDGFNPGVVDKSTDKEDHATFEKNVLQL